MIERHISAAFALNFLVLPKNWHRRSPAHRRHHHKVARAFPSIFVIRQRIYAIESAITAADVAKLYAIIAHKIGGQCLNAAGLPMFVSVIHATKSHRSSNAHVDETTTDDERCNDVIQRHKTNKTRRFEIND